MRAPQFLASLFAKHQLELRLLIAYKFNKSPHDAEDVVQDAFHNILRMDNLENLENPKAYLFQAASNLALNRIRKQRNHQNYLAAMDAEETNELTPERSACAASDLHRLEQALERLPFKYRRTFLLSRVQEKSYREISEILGISESTVEKHIIKALKYLRDQLADEVAI